MPRVCSACSHKDVRKINRAIAQEEAFSKIASKANLTYRCIELHAKKHVRPALQAAAQAVQTDASNALTRLRPEINYAPLEKTKWMQDKIANELDNTKILLDTSDRIALMRELRGWFDIENKLCGNYQQDRPNAENLEVVKLKAAIEARAAEKGITYEQELQHYLDRYSGDVRPEVKDRLADELGQVG